MKTLILYDADPDGFGSAYAAWDYFYDDVDYVEVLHGTNMPVEAVQYDTVCVFDLSFSRDDYTALLDEGVNVGVIDHHPTSQALHEELKISLVPIDNSRAACVQVWEYFHETEPPMLLQYVADRDVWAWKLDGSELVNNYLYTVPKTFEAWYLASRQIDFHLESVLQKGEAIQKYKEKLVEQMVENIHWDGSVPYVEAPILHSEVGHKLLEMHPDAPYVATFSLNPTEGTQKWSLRSEDHRMDVSKIAREAGGGGHRNAAGYIKTRMEA